MSTVNTANTIFIETHTDGDLKLAFIKSANVRAFPCGRRRSEDLATSNYRIPFDPEARLNTEANNRRHSSINGYTQTYLKSWETPDDSTTTGLLTLSLAGYLFNITLNKLTDATGKSIDFSQVDTFGTQLVSALGEETAQQIYANILIEDTPLLASSTQTYYTEVLRNQSASDNPELSLDLIISAYDTSTEIAQLQNFNNYYFSGLSFSTSPLTRKDGTRSDNAITTTNLSRQNAVSLLILEKIDGSWQIHEPAWLPLIEHGETADSIVVTGDALLKSDLYVKENIYVGDPSSVTSDDKNYNSSVIAQQNIIAKNDVHAGYDITAGQDITAGNNITATELTTTKSLTVTEDASITQLYVTTNAQIEDLDVNTNIDTKTLLATESIQTPVANVTDQLNVTNDNLDARAQIDRANMINAYVAAVLDVGGVIQATADHQNSLGQYVNNARIKRAYVETLTADTVTAATSVEAPMITATDNLYQNNDSGTTMKVPIIELKQVTSATYPVGDYYQLQISRIGAKPTNTTSS